MTMRFGRYETLRPIASGGMATVHLGRALGVGGFERLVAIKLMHQHIAEEREFVAMFLDEARMAAGIRHPNVVATIDVQHADAGLFLVMEYIEGPSLRAMLRSLAKEGKRLPPAIAVRIFIDLLAGLHAAHQLTGKDGTPLHLVHRDVSPANILVGSDGVTRITDFGVARARARLTTTEEGRVKGKVSYMPPEQILAEPVDARTDVYAAGVVLWEVLTGQRLFQADNDGALLNAILAGATQAPSEVVSDVPQPLDAVCMGALALEKDGRYASALAFSEALERGAAEAGITIATARAVAAFVEELGVHEKVDIALLDRQMSTTARDALPGRDVAPTDADEAVDGAERAGGVPGTRVTTTLRGRTLGLRRPSPRRSLLLALAAGAALGAIAYALLVERTPLGGEHAADGSAEESAAAAAAPNAAAERRAALGAAGSAGAAATETARAGAAGAATAYPPEPATPPTGKRRSVPRTAPRRPPAPVRRPYDPRKL